jgi:NAD+ synthase
MDYLSQRRQLVDWLYDYLSLSKKEGFVIGLSGGIDSLTLALMGNEAAHRCGGKCHTIISKMDSTYDYVDNSYAKQAVQMFGFPSEFLDLSEPFDALRRVLPSMSHSAAYTNLKARLRTAVLYYYANNQNLMMLGTVNRGEFMIGYFPKNASAGDILPMAHLSKREIRGIAETYGVPDDMRNRKASGCIFADTAEEEWGFTEEELDRMCDHIVAGHRQRPDGISDTKWVRFYEQYLASRHKRVFYPLFKSIESDT